jgi:hypothetical protein
MGPTIQQAFSQKCAVVFRVLDSLESAVKERDANRLKHAFAELGPASDELTGVAESAQELAAELPTFSDQPGLNDIFVLGLNVLHGDSVEESGLTARLPGLYGWFKSLEGILSELRSDYPDELELRASAEAAIGDVREALGGFVLFFEERKLNDLSLALSLLDKGTRSLARCLQVLQDLRNRRLKFSQDPVLEAVYGAARRWAEGADMSALEVQRALGNLLEAHVMDLELTRQRGFLPYSVHRELFQKVEDCHTNMNEILTALAQETEAEVFLENLNDFREFAQELDGIDQQLRLFERPKLTGSPAFKDLFETMEGVYLERVPDDHLREKLHHLRSAHQQYIRGLELMPHKSDEELMLEECLMEHAIGFQELDAYLQTGDRTCLLKAYEAMLPASTDLEELDQSHRPGTPVDGPLDLLDSDADIAQSRGYRQILALVEAGKAGGVESEECLENLRTLIQNAEKARQTLNSQVRPLVLGQDDQEALGYYEQLNVILEYQLDGLYRLEEALAIGTHQAINEAVQELAEVDAYLVTFRETQEKLVGSRPK